MINRTISGHIIKRLADPKAIIIYGPRQAGKSTLLRLMEPQFKPPVLWLNGDEPDHRQMLAQATSSRLRNLIGKAKTLIIDEAQRIENIGLTIKLIIDQIPGVKVLATGSSTFELSNRINEPLTGRKWVFNLFPLSWQELAEHTSVLEEHRLLDVRMTYGYFPEIINHPGEEQSRLRELASSYLYKDILTWERIQKPEKLERLLQALALQTGSQVSYNELGQMAGIDNQTTEKYINLLEQSFIIYRLSSFSRNLRNELKKSRKIYFYDTGMRNAILNNFKMPQLRLDKGAQWENFILTERIKFLSNNLLFMNRYFWRTTAGQEIDYIEEKNNLLHAFEIKWNPEKNVRFPATFLTNYPEAVTHVINRSNYEDFLLHEDLPLS